MNDRFDPLTISFRRPIESTFKIGGWILVMPLVVAVVWGIYNPNNFMSVLGISGRRATGAFVQETSPIGESLLNGTTGNGLRPGLSGGTRDGRGDRESLRPAR